MSIDPRSETIVKRSIASLMLLALLATGCSDGDPTEDTAGMANPASEHCIEQGGDLDIRKDAEGNESGYCVFADGTEVEEWAYFNGEAEPTLP